jgi:hypothetical protein
VTLWPVEIMDTSTEDMRPIASNHAGEIRLVIYRISKQHLLLRNKPLILALEDILDRKARISDPDASEDIERIATFIFKYRTIGAVLVPLTHTSASNTDVPPSLPMNDRISINE